MTLQVGRTGQEQRLSPIRRGPPHRPSRNPLQEKRILPQEANVPAHRRTPPVLRGPRQDGPEGRDTVERETANRNSRFPSLFCTRARKNLLPGKYNGTQTNTDISGFRMVQIMHGSFSLDCF